MQNNPNILFFQVDQLMANALSCYGNTFCISPNLDRIATEGVVFEQAYCNFPLCAPSRASMATGQLCSTIGAYDNAAELPAHIPTYAHYLRDMGYRTILSGKMHFIGPDQHHGFEKRLTPDLYPADFAWVPNWENEGKRDTNDARGVTISGVATRTVQMDFDEETTHRAIQEIYAQAQSNDTRPFFMQVSWTHPHEPFLCLQEYWDLYEGLDIPPPTVGPLSEDEHDAHAIRTLSDFGMLTHRFSQTEISTARRAYYASISYIDEMIGQILDTLEKAGLRDNTAIVFTSDHGEMLGERGIWFKKHFFENSLKVPLLLNAPWLAPQRISTLVSLVDLLPTFCGLAQGSPWESNVENLEGDDLTALLEAQDDAPARSIYAEYLAEATPDPIFMIRRGDFKYITSNSDPDLLFNVARDPNELENLAEKLDHVEITSAFRDEANHKWDARILKQDILLSQRRRQLVKSAHSKGQSIRWNHGETPDENVPWFRGQGSYNDWAFSFLPKTDSD
jgi:choline-sulfatase